MLSERITLLMSVINAENADIAELAGFDRSNISRLRSGARVPLKTGSSMGRFVDAVMGFALSKGKGEAMAVLIGYDGKYSPEEFRSALLDWLYEDTALPEIRESLTDTDTRLYFGKKLNAIMKAAGMSNVKLSKAVNIDPSYLSRMRSGKQLPNERSKVVERICDVLIRRTIDRDELDKLAEAVNIPEELLAAQPGLLAEWLLSSSETAYKAPVVQLLNTIGAIELDREIPVPEPDMSLAEAVLSDASERYRGTEGLRRAVMRFLMTTIRSGKELLLYSDQSMEWMGGDFHMKWLSLMAGVLKKGVNIKIIHNIERSSSEMLQAIASWLPLYMSGLIVPYYCVRRQGARFSHTIFLDPDNGCIEGSCAAGFENICDYRYITDPDELAMCRKQYDSLMADCRPLIKISRAIPPQSEDGLHKTEGNIRMDIRRDEAVLCKLSEPRCSFRFDHPLLLGAFRNYIL